MVLKIGHEFLSQTGSGFQGPGHTSPLKDMSSTPSPPGEKPGTLTLVSPLPITIFKEEATDVQLSLVFSVGLLCRSNAVEPGFNEPLI